MKRFISLLLFDIGATLELLGTPKDKDCAVAMRLHAERDLLLARWQQSKPQNRRRPAWRRLVAHPIWHYSPAAILRAVQADHDAQAGKVHSVPLMKFPENVVPWRN